MSNVQSTKTKWVSSFCLDGKASITILSNSVNCQEPQEERASLPSMNLDKLYSLEVKTQFSSYYEAKTSRAVLGGLC